MVIKHSQMLTREILIVCLASLAKYCAYGKLFDSHCSALYLNVFERRDDSNWQVV